MEGKRWRAFWSQKLQNVDDNDDDGAKILRIVMGTNLRHGYKFASWLSGLASDSPLSLATHPHWLKELRRLVCSSVDCGAFDDDIDSKQRYLNKIWLCGEWSHLWHWFNLIQIQSSICIWSLNFPSATVSPASHCIASHFWHTTHHLKNVLWSVFWSDEWQLQAWLHETT